MADYQVEKIYPRDEVQVDRLLQAEGIERDAHLDYTAGIFDEQQRLVATGSCYHNTLRCLAVDQHQRGQGLMNLLVTHLVNYQYQRGQTHLFIYTKFSCRHLFQSIGFHEVATVPGKIAFLENQPQGFATFCQQLAAQPVTKTPIAGIVMNANPFTLGHQALIAQAAAENAAVHVFLVADDVSLFPTAIRWQLLQAGVAHLNNVYLHLTGPYLISTATFPSYFLKDTQAVTAGQAQLDAVIFSKIAQKLGITTRYVGEEPTSQTTNQYNQVMQTAFKATPLTLKVVPRLQVSGRAVSATTVRQAIKLGDWALIKQLVPPTTLTWLLSNAAQPVIKQIKQASVLQHG